MRGLPTCLPVAQVLCRNAEEGRVTVEDEAAGPYVRLVAGGAVSARYANLGQNESAYWEAHLAVEGVQATRDASLRYCA